MIFRNIRLLKKLTTLEIDCYAAKDRNSSMEKTIISKSKKIEALQKQVKLYKQKEVARSFQCDKTKVSTVENVWV